MEINQGAPAVAVKEIVIAAAPETVGLSIPTSTRGRAGIRISLRPN